MKTTKQIKTFVQKEYGKSSNLDERFALSMILEFIDEGEEEQSDHYDFLEKVYVMESGSAIAHKARIISYNKGSMGYVYLIEFEFSKRMATKYAYELFPVMEENK